jgi:hypothetical protein
MYSSMTAERFRAALVRLGLSHRQIATFLGVDDRLVRDWAGGRKLVPSAKARLSRPMQGPGGLAAVSGARLLSDAITGGEDSRPRRPPRRWR